MQLAPGSKPGRDERITPFKTHFAPCLLHGRPVNFWSANQHPLIVMGGQTEKIMFEKISKNGFRSSTGNESWIGLVILIMFVVLSYFAGRSDGRSAVDAEVPHLAEVEHKLDKIDKAVSANRDCANLMLEASRVQQ